MTVPRSSSEESPRERDSFPVRWSWWAVAAGAALIAASQWLHAPSVDYLVALIVATVAALVTAFLVRGGPRWWATAASLSLAVAALVAGVAQQQLTRVDRHWDDWRRDASAAQSRGASRAIDDAVRHRNAPRPMRCAARPIAQRAFGQLEHLVDRDLEQAVIVYRHGVPFAWGGTTRVAPDMTHDSASVVASPFYLSLQFVERSDSATAVVTTLLGAISPGDRLASPIANQIANETGIAAFSFEPPADSASTPSVLRYATDNRRLFDVRANPLVQGEVVAAHRRESTCSRRCGVRRRADLLRHRRLARDATSGAACRRARRRSRDDGARSAQPVLESHAAVRPGVLLHAEGRPADR